ncbi:CsgG/HfaB family protein [Fodinicurvata fenggangensis]|uniref:CsgG/HfaB family protein n=1 Tax=Fodinicurvata fenggangensis TaxID=1121830 RepID=UPI000554671D|nr:CsgG/HfaB family protein [Fodinicurvata fenggangensis]
MRNGILATIGILFSALVLTGCAQTEGSSSFNQTYNFRDSSRIAVVAVEGLGANEAARTQVSNMVTQDLMGKGYSPIERDRVREIIDEQDFQLSERTTAAGAARIGRILNTDLAMIISIPSYREDMSLSARAVDVQTAEIVWTGSGSGTTGDGMNQAVGAFLGAAAGAVTGAAVTEHDTTGAIVGGTAGAAGGGLAGAALTPRKEEQMRELVTKVMEGFPSRMSSFGS